MPTVTLYHIVFNEEPGHPAPPRLIQAEATERLTDYALQHDDIPLFGYVRSVPKSQTNLTPMQAWERFTDAQTSKRREALAKVGHASSAVAVGVRAIHELAYGVYTNAGDVTLP